MKKYELQDFELDNESLKLGETIFHNANGYIGVRGCFEEGYPEGFDTVRGTYINGFYDFVSMPQAEKLCGLTEEKQTIVNVADMQGIELYVCGERFSLFEGTVLSKKRWLDMEKGVTCREITWQSPEGNIVKIRIKRMCSFTILPLFLIEYSVQAVNFDGEILIKSTHTGEVMNYFNPNDPRVAGEACKHMFTESTQFKQEVSVISAITANSALRAVTAVSHAFSKEVERGQEIIEESAVFSFRTKIAKEETLVCHKYCIICDSVRYKNTKEEALLLMETVRQKNTAELFKEQEDYLSAFWGNCGVDILGEEELNKAIRYNMYQLIQSAGKEPHSNVAAKGLSGEGYEGHFFWDTEMYLQPFYILNAREIAQNLIRYRYTILDYAKENAKILGHKKGAAYPWRTIMGKECSGYFPSGSAQYHINGDIAYSIAAYYLATKEIDLLEECGCEMLIETARLWMDIGNYHEGKFYINTVTGPDEYTCLVNNNYYTNVLAAYNLKWAYKSFELLKEEGRETAVEKKTGITKEELSGFIKAAAAMYLPYDEKLGINPQDDSFLQKSIWEVSDIREEEKPLLLHYHPMYLYRYQICKQADTVLAHFILEDEQDIETIRKSFAYYERITTHDSSLSTCIFSIVAAKLGMLDKAYEYLGESAKLDLFNTHKNTADGIHTANMGGTYMAVVYGFGGLRIKVNGLHLEPRLPKAWQGLRFSFSYEDAQIEVNVTEEKCVITLLKGQQKELYVYGKKVLLTKTLTFLKEEMVG